VASQREDDHFFFCRLTQLGFLRLLATSAVMGKDVRTIGEAWKVYDRWLEDSRVGIRQEPVELDGAFRAANPFGFPALVAESAWRLLFAGGRQGRRRYARDV
jgi:hypothetical protein